jgi:hypothetical protein
LEWPGTKSCCPHEGSVTSLRTRARFFFVPPSRSVASSERCSANSIAPEMGLSRMTEAGTATVDHAPSTAASGSSRPGRLGQAARRPAHEPTAHAEHQRRRSPGRLPDRRLPRARAGERRRPPAPKKSAAHASPADPARASRSYPEAVTARRPQREGPERKDLTPGHQEPHQNGVRSWRQCVGSLCAIAVRRSLKQQRDR